LNLSEIFSHPNTLVSLLAALGPVLLFLLALFFLDTFRLVRGRRVGWAIAVGVGTGFASYVVNTSLLGLLGWPVIKFAVLLAPLVEESIKALYVGWLLHTRRAGFLIDAAILGFATGTGFAVTENLFYLHNLPDAPLFVWIIRGFGTAIMHGGATAIFAITARALTETRMTTSWRIWLPGLAAAILLHSMFNRLLTKPILATVIILVVLPLLMKLVYRVGENRLRRWLGQGFDRDTELLGLINEGQVRETPLGKYLVSLRGSFRADTVVDMLCLLRLQAELSIRAKGILLLREHGLKPNPDPDLRAKLKEVRHLENNIGKTGELALRPVCRWKDTDRWQRHLLEEL
jgi:protease PrsW